MTTNLIFVGKPNVNNMLHAKEFDTPKKAVDYINSLLPDSYPVIPLEDAYLIGKVYEKSGDTSWLTKKKPIGRPKKANKNA